MKNGLNHLKVFMFIFIITGLTALTIAAGGGGGGGSKGGSGSSDIFSGMTKNDSQVLYQKGVEADKSGDYKTALQYFQEALKKDSNNHEILNMLAHSQRNLGMIDEALANYKKALAIKPDFADAREYLGEAYIQAAVREIDILKSYGSKGDKQRKDLIAAFKKAAADIK